MSAATTVKKRKGRRDGAGRRKGLILLTLCKRKKKMLELGLAGVFFKPSLGKEGREERG